MNFAEYQLDTSTHKEQNPKRLPLEKQIRIDIDKYSNGDVLSVSIHNATKCDMSEYARAIRFLETLPVYFRAAPGLVEFVKGLKANLTKIEKAREANSGAYYSEMYTRVPIRKFTE